MNEQQVAEAVRDWLRETLPDLNAGYAYLPSMRSALPDVAVEVVEKRLVRGEEERRFPFRAIQQADLRVFEVLASFMVESAVDAAADEAETQMLQGFGRDVEAGLLTDATLGDRVQMASPFAVFDYRLPFIQYHDGTRGRQMEANVAVAELVQGIS